MKTTSQEKKFIVNGNSLPISAQAAGEALTRIYRKHNGKLTPKFVVDEAKDKKHPLHTCFEWDDTKAGREYRLYQAGRIIKCITIKKDSFNKDVVKVRAFVSIKTNADKSLTHNPFAKGDTFYVSVDDAMKNKVLRRYTVAQAFQDLQNWMNKYENIHELSGLFDQINREMYRYKGKSN